MAASCQNVKTNHLNEADENKVKTFFSVVMGGGSGLGVGGELYAAVRSSSQRLFLGM